jgi:hypothetical protein
MAPGKRTTKIQGKKMFRYEVMWESHENFSPWMFNAWQEEKKATTVQELHRKLAAVTRKLDGWGRTISPYQFVQRHL